MGFWLDRDCHSLADMPVPWGNPESPIGCESDISLAGLAAHPHQLVLSLLHKNIPLFLSVSLYFLFSSLACWHTPTHSQTGILLSEKSIQIKPSNSKVRVSPTLRCYTRQFVTEHVGSNPFDLFSACVWPQAIQSSAKTFGLYPWLISTCRASARHKPHS